MPAEYRKLARIAKDQGWEITQPKSGHLHWKPPTGRVVYSASTPSCYKATMNLRASLKRSGLKLDER